MSTPSVAATMRPAVTAAGAAVSELRLTAGDWARLGAPTGVDLDIELWIGAVRVIVSCGPSWIDTDGTTRLQTARRRADGEHTVQITRYAFVPTHRPSRTRAERLIRGEAPDA